MFDKLNSSSESPSLIISEKELKEMPQLKLYALFTEAKWQSLTEGSRLAALQEVENRSAKLDGRTPNKVIKGKGGKFRPRKGKNGIRIVFGEQNYRDNTIAINYLALEGESAIICGAHALETLLHEGRHAFQNYLIDKGVTDDSPDIVKEWYTWRIHYEAQSAIYSVQPIEEDARRFARREMLKIYEALERQMGPDKTFETVIQDGLAEEHRFAMRVKEELTLEDIDRKELALLEKLKKVKKDLDISDLHVFDSARLILQTDIDFSDPRLMIPLLEKLDRIADEKLAKLDTGDLNHIRAMKRLR